MIGIHRGDQVDHSGQTKIQLFEFVAERGDRTMGLFRSSTTWALITVLLWTE
jgi:hypothetical protein